MWFVGAPVIYGGDLPADLEMVATRTGDRHVTLVYLGRVPHDTALHIWRSLPQLALPEHVQAAGWERFGRRAIGLRLRDDDGKLRTAAEACFAGTAEQLSDFRRPDRLRPHVTLGRIPKPAAPPTPAAMHAWPVPAEPLGLGPPTLFRSTGNATGNRYEVTAEQAHTARGDLS